MTIFGTIFDTADSASATGSASEGALAGYLPVQASEEILTAPHDPWELPTAGLRDPKIVRETLPPAANVFDWISAITKNISVAAEGQRQSTSDPATVGEPSVARMAEGAKTTDGLIDKAPSPGKSDPGPVYQAGPAAG